MSDQLALPFEHRPSYHRAAFLPDASNEEALTWLQADWPTGRLALWGSPGCGKTHLLHCWAAACDGMIVPGSGLSGLPRIPEVGGLAVDDADAAPERPLLHLLNAAAEAGRPVLLAARQAPSRWPTRLPDLASRLRAIPAVEIAASSDEMLRDLFASLLAARQLAVPEAVQKWLLVRLPREPAALREAAARLDLAALEAGRRVTQAMAAQVVAGSDDGA
jgi:chromosomal replication initiation ATPase DnaA